ncbi:MAG: hypothetical protein JWP11_868 [Frankiales bacterium]|nr:hypothetical protein [Frankiales bacterium]
MTDVVDELRARLSPVELSCEEGYEGLLAAVRQIRPASSRRRRFVAIGAVSAAVMGIGGVAVATGGSHTGLFGLPGATENDTSEYLDLNAPDFRDVALRYTSGFDYAPGYSAQMYLGLLDPRRMDADTAPELRGRGYVMQVTGVRGSGLSWAFCSWARTSTTDPGALEHMRRLADSDLARRINLRSYNLRLVEQAQQGDPAPLQQYVDINCPDPRPWPAS